MVFGICTLFLSIRIHGRVLCFGIFCNELGRICRFICRILCRCIASTRSRPAEVSLESIIFFRAQLLLSSLRLSLSVSGLLKISSLLLDRYPIPER